jgi:hypothetical protein
VRMRRVSYKLRILSLGAGVQSTTLLLMAERGEIEPFHCAIFADTGWEGKQTYDHLDYLRQICKTPIITVRNDKGSIYDWSLNAKLRDSKLFNVLPLYTVLNGKKGMTRRQCTSHFKVAPIRREIRRMLDVNGARIAQGAVNSIIGISWDERQRMYLSNVKYIENDYPLVYRRMDRDACIKWLMDNYQITVPKSSCIGCPFHSDREWRNVMGNEKSWGEAVNLDETIRESGRIAGRLDGLLYLHKSCKPLAEVDLRTPEERGQLAFDFDDAISLRCKEQKLNIMVNGLSNL